MACRIILVAQSGMSALPKTLCVPPTRAGDPWSTNREPTVPTVIAESSDRTFRGIRFVSQTCPVGSLMSDRQRESANASKASAPNTARGSASVIQSIVAPRE